MSTTRARAVDLDALPIIYETGNIVMPDLVQALVADLRATRLERDALAEDLASIRGTLPAPEGWLQGIEGWYHSNYVVEPVLRGRIVLGWVGYDGLNDCYHFDVDGQPFRSPHRAMGALAAGATKVVLPAIPDIDT